MYVFVLNLRIKYVTYALWIRETRINILNAKVGALIKEYSNDRTSFHRGGASALILVWLTLLSVVRHSDFSE